MRVAVNGTELHVTLAGDDSRPALFLNHSLATNHEMWGMQLPVFARHFRVVAFDMRGHGASTAPAGTYSMDQLADDVVALADHLNLKTFHFLGLSIGGLVGQSLGLRHGGRLQKLILSSTFTGPVNAEGKKGWDERIAMARAHGMQSQVEVTMARWLSADFQQAAPHSAQWIRDLIAETPIDGFCGCAAAIRDMNLEPNALKSIMTPTLVIAGEKDPGATPAAGQRIVEAIAGAQFFVLPGGYHLGNVEFPHHFSERALEFLLGAGNG
jgi:3-oxoadipate enol-lactonase